LEDGPAGLERVDLHLIGGLVQWLGLVDDPVDPASDGPRRDDGERRHPREQ
jgi:hypothetical protein